MKNKGITLIVLVITIVVLIILAGVTINLSFGENGIFKKAEYAKEKENESAARDNVERALMEANMEKETNVGYNKEDFLNEILEKNSIVVNGDTVISGNYLYIIDREKLEIIETLGKTEIILTTDVTGYLGKNANGNYEVSLLLEIESNVPLKNIVFQNLDGTTFEISTEKEKVAKDLTVELDKEYIVTIETKTGKIEKRTILEKSTETIRTVEELVTFRDKVNSGLTYEGKSINLGANIDLSTVCGEDFGTWEPIGRFKGVFNGNYYTISNIYINTTSRDQALFDINYGTIKCLCVVGGSISASYNTAVIAAINYGVIENCETNVDILNNSTNGGANGGICGTNVGEIRYCFNLGNITKTGSNVNSLGGIAGVNSNGGKITGCYNRGNITGSLKIGGIVGSMFDRTNKRNVYLTDCYNTGRMSGSSYVGAISSINGFDGNYPGGTVSNTYFLQGTASKGVSLSYAYTITQANVKTEKELKSSDMIRLLGDNWVEDGKIKNEKGEWIDNLDEEGNKIYINDGYPILKWQMENKK